MFEELKKSKSEGDCPEITASEHFPHNFNGNNLAKFGPYLISIQTFACNT